jgi:soluble lytic murein transglycosylase-like protein
MFPAIQAQRQSVEQTSRTAAAPAAQIVTNAEFSGCGAVPQPDLDSMVRAAAARESLEPALLHAVIGQESQFRPCAVSSKGAMGLMQLMPDTAADLGVADPFDPEQNVNGGARLLRLLLERYQGNLALALGAYNAGPGRVDRFGAIPRIPETMDYVRKILTVLSPNLSMEERLRNPPEIR